MLNYFLISFLILAIVIILMAIGYLVKKQSLSGSCGGIAALGLTKECNCDEPCEKRKAKIKKEEERKKNQLDVKEL